MKSKYFYLYSLLSIFVFLNSAVSSDTSELPVLSIEKLQSLSSSRDHQTSDASFVINKAQVKNIKKKPAHYNCDRSKVVMTLDGGGGKGYMEALMLLHLETRVSEILNEGKAKADIGPKKKIGEMIYMFGGTSTGAITALALTTPSENNPKLPKYGAQDVVDLYENECSEIFQQSWYQYVKSGNGTLCEKYSDFKLDELLLKKLGNAKIGESVTNVFATAFELKKTDEGSKSVVFRSYELSEKPVLDVTARQAAAASAAAPTYFSPETIAIFNPANSKIESRSFLDGGLTGWNNPDTLAFIQALSLVDYQESKEDDVQEKTEDNQPEKIQNDFEKSKTKLADFLFVSIGAGECPMYYDRADFENKTLIKTIEPIINIAFDAPKESNISIFQELTSLLRLNNYYRLSPDINKPIALDDMSLSIMQYMKKCTEEYIIKKADEFEVIAHRMAFDVLIKDKELNEPVYENKAYEYAKDAAAVLFREKKELQAKTMINQFKIDMLYSKAYKQGMTDADIAELEKRGQILAENTPAVIELNDYRRRSSDNASNDQANIGTLTSTSNQLNQGVVNIHASNSNTPRLNGSPTPRKFPKSVQDDLNSWDKLTTLLLSPRIPDKDKVDMSLSYEAAKNTPVYRAKLKVSNNEEANADSMYEIGKISQTSRVKGKPSEPLVKTISSPALPLSNIRFFRSGLPPLDLRYLDVNHVAKGVTPRRSTLYDLSSSSEECTNDFEKLDTPPFRPNINPSSVAKSVDTTPGLTPRSAKSSGLRFTQKIECVKSLVKLSPSNSENNEIKQADKNIQQSNGSNVCSLNQSKILSNSHSNNDNDAPLSTRSGLKSDSDERRAAKSSLAISI